MNITTLKLLLDAKVEQYQHLGFIEKDPVQIPHRFQRKEDIEIAAFFAALFAWGKREMILQKLDELMDRMNQSPHQFVLGEKTKWSSMTGFKHRTIKAEDIISLMDFLRNHYTRHASLESAFSPKVYKEENTENALVYFQDQVFSTPGFTIRTRKHVSSPLQKSSCKRLSLFLRWMVRGDIAGVDFGLWKNFKPSQLVMPMDIHVSRVAFRLGLIETPLSNWLNAVQLTNLLKELDPHDPVKYDYALFSLGNEEGMV